ncbi:MAG: hemolysin family protein [Bacteroidia bacterium]|nr:hemolysin family protein [Bacteroidia bacterium]
MTLPVSAMLVAAGTWLGLMFFSGLEAAFSYAQKLKLSMRAAQGDRAADRIMILKHRAGEVYLTLVIVMSLLMALSVRYTWEAVQTLHADGFQAWAWSGGVCLLMLLLSEGLIRPLFRVNADRLVLAFVPVLYGVWWPFSYPISLIFKAIDTIRPAPEFPGDASADLRELEDYIREVIEDGGQPPPPDLDTEMLSNVMALKDTRAREFMIPRTNIVSAPHDSTLDELKAIFIETRLSKVIIYQDTLDQVLGFVHSISLFQQPGALAGLVQPVLMIPETMPANVLLKEFISQKRSVAIVVDEFGGTAGLITFEDLVEEVFGEIEDEHDREVPGEEEEDLIMETLEDGSLHLGARLEIYRINETFELELPEDTYYTTLGGLITYITESIPTAGETLVAGDYKITVLKSTHTRVIAVRLEPYVPEETAPD